MVVGALSRSLSPGGRRALPRRTQRQLDVRGRPTDHRGERARHLIRGTPGEAEEEEAAAPPLPPFSVRVIVPFLPLFVVCVFGIIDGLGRVVGARANLRRVPPAAAYPAYPAAQAPRARALAARALHGEGERGGGARQVVHGAGQGVHGEPRARHVGQGDAHQPLGDGLGRDGHHQRAQPVAQPVVSRHPRPAAGLHVHVVTARRGGGHARRGGRIPIPRPTPQAAPLSVRR
mmetsp:Transcript_23998/g.58828  ORF Transcript_23998/g.58828 Transcript_23998/m.58828 type:complete len:232 (+) Transcript_23998:296-991(+)